MAEELDVVIGSHRLHAQRFGPAAAPLVIAVHGLTGSMRQFDEFGDRLGGDLQLVAVDLRGRGDSDSTPPGSYGWEHHARDVFAVADALGFQRLSLVGVSMGGSVAMKAAELNGSRLDAVVLLDVAGRVDPGVGRFVASVIDELDEADPRAAHPAAVAEDRSYTLTQDPYGRWRHLTMPTLLLRATEELAPGAGYVVPPDDRDRFAREVPSAVVIEVEASHQTICSHPDAADATRDFLTAVLTR